jgi:hypothetical protein
VLGSLFCSMNVGACWFTGVYVEGGGNQPVLWVLGPVGKLVEVGGVVVHVGAGEEGGVEVVGRW